MCGRVTRPGIVLLPDVNTALLLWGIGKYTRSSVWHTNMYRQTNNNFHIITPDDTDLFSFMASFLPELTLLPAEHAEGDSMEINRDTHSVMLPDMSKVLGREDIDGTGRQ